MLDAETIFAIKNDLIAALKKMLNKLQHGNFDFDCAETAVEELVMDMTNELSKQMGLPEDSTLLLSGLANIIVDELDKRQNQSSQGETQDIAEYLDECEQKIAEKQQA